MINSVNINEQDVAVNANVVFDTDRVRTRACGCGGWLLHDVGSGTFDIVRPGIYKVDFNANVTAAAAGDTTLAIQNNGVTIGGTEMDYVVAVAGDFQNVSASTLVVVQPYGSRTISVANISATEVTVDDANIIVTRIA
jgi:hypothetical protein